MGPSHNCKSPFDFAIEFAETFIFDNRLPAINDTGSRQEILRYPFLKSLNKSLWKVKYIHSLFFATCPFKGMGSSLNQLKITF